MTGFDTSELLISRGIITRDLAQRALQVPPNVSSSRVGRLIAAGADLRRVLDALAQSTGIAVATEDLIGWATPVPLLPSTARQLHDLVACPVRRDPSGILHVIIADPETQPVLDRMLIDFKVYLAPENTVRELMHKLYGRLLPEQPMEAIDIDMEASRRHLRAPPPEAIDIDLEASGKFGAARPSSDPLQARPSGKFNRPQHYDEPTMRVARSPKAPPTAPAGNVAVLDQDTIADAQLPLDDTLRAVQRRAFINGIVLGAAVTATIAALIIVLLVL